MPARLYTLVGVLFCALGVAGVGQTISVDEAEFVFDPVMEGAFVTHVFVLTNVGGKMLEIERVRVSCGCTAMALSKTTLEPGESVELEAVLDTVGYGGREIIKTIYVESNDPRTPRLMLAMKGEVRALAPYHIAAGDVNYLLYLMIDLRSPEAFASGHLMGAVNIPFNELGDWIPLLPENVLIIVYDEDGSLADLAAHVLIDFGHRDAKSLLGGFAQWRAGFRDQFVWPPQRGQ